MQYLKEAKFSDGINLLESTIVENGNATASDYYAISKLYIFTNQFDKSLEVLLKAQKLEAGNLLVQLNLAHTYMFLDNKELCKAIHKRFQNQNVLPTQTWKNKTINDLDEFKKAGLSDANFNKVLRIID